MATSQFQKSGANPPSPPQQIKNPISNLAEITHPNEHQSPKAIELSRIQDPEGSDPTQLILDNQDEDFPGNDFSPTIKNRGRRQVYRRRKPGELMRQKTIDKKVDNLLKAVNFVPFMPVKILGFDKYEGLLKGLGLWDFAGLEFDDEIRGDIIGQFIVSYDAVKRFSIVNGVRIYMSRRNFVKALNLPEPKPKNKKEKLVGSAVEEAIDLDAEGGERLSDDCVKFLENFVWNWMVLREDEWVVPSEIKDWMGLIKAGYPDRVDWGGFFWVMVENELKQRDQLLNCYYASHLQYYIKSQCKHKDVFEEEGKKIVAIEKIKEQGKTLSQEDNKQADVVEIKLELFEEEVIKVEANEGINEVQLSEKGNKEVQMEDIKKDEDLLEEAHKVDEKVVEEGDLVSGKQQGVELVEKVKEGLNGAEVENVEEETDGSFFDSINEQDNVVTEGPNMELALPQQDTVEREKINGFNMMDAEECKENEQDGSCLAVSDQGGKPFLRPCILGEGRGSDGNEEGKQELEQLQIEEGGQMEEGQQHIREAEQMQNVEHIQKGEQMEELEQFQGWGDAEEADDVDEVEVDDTDEQAEVEDEDEELEDGIEHNIPPNYGSPGGDGLPGDLLQAFETSQMPLNLQADDVDEVEVDDTDEQVEVEDEVDEDEELEDGIEHTIPPNYGSPGRDGLPGDLLQAFETSHMPLNLQGQQIHENSSMELFASNAETHLMMGGPSMYGNGHKRAIEYDQDTSHLNESKRIRTDVGWDQKTLDFGFCMGQAEQLMEKAKIMYAEKERTCNEINMNQQYLLRELQQRDNYIESLKRSRNEEVQKKDAVIYRLERELRIFEELVNGYREALKVNRRSFQEYRERCQLPEEPIYKDAGPGGLVLSVTEIEKQRQQQENEERLKKLTIQQKFTEAFEGYSNQFEVLLSRVHMIDMNRLTPMEKEVKALKELYATKCRASEKEDLVPTEIIPPSA